MSGRLLAISWATLPMSAPRAMQVCRLLAHLPDQGWKPDVITSRECADVAEETAEQKIAAAYDRQYTRHEVEPREDRAPSAWLTRAWRRWSPPKSVNDANWIARATALAMRRLNRAPFEALVTFAQPWTDHLIGLRIKRRRPEIPWLAHFSDPWADSPYYAAAAPKDKAIAAAQERAVIAAADIVVFVTRQTADLVMGKYPRSWHGKARVIPHGFDADILRRINITPGTTHSSNDARRMRIVHTGSLYHGLRPATGVLQALADLRRSDKDLPIEVTFIGHNPPSLHHEIKRFGLDDVVFCFGPKAWSESLHAASTADLLLIIDAPAKDSVFLPSKLVEYLSLRKPILGLTPECGASADLLRRVGYGVAPPEDPVAIASRLEGLLAAWRAGRLGPSIQHDLVAAEYDMRHVAGQFTTLLSEMSGMARASGT